MPAGAWGLEAASVDSLDVSSVTVASSPGETPLVTALDSQRVGIGGGGALFYPAISPHDSNNMSVSTDMGDLYVSHDAGASWSKKSLGVTYAVAYDPVDATREYAGGYGVWRSSDSGESFERLWPSHITGEYTNYEGFGYFLANSDGYRPTTTVRSIAVDPADKRHIFVMLLADGVYEVWESIDDGVTFTLLASRKRNLHKVNQWDDHTKVVVHDGAPWLCTQDGIFRYDADAGGLVALYTPDGEARHYVIDVDQVASDGTGGLAKGTYYWIAEALQESGTPNKTSLRRFRLLEDGSLEFADLTDAMNDPDNGLNRANRKNSGAMVEVRIRELAGATATRVYFYTPTAGNDYCALARYDAEKEAPFSWVYGYRLNDDVPYNYCLANPSHADTYYKMWGIATSPTDPNRFLLTTGFGAYGSPDCEVPKAAAWKSDYPRNSNVSQLYANRVASETVKFNYYEKYAFSSTGLNNVTTYGLRADPFDGNHMALMNTDFGLTLSNDGGKSWSRANVKGNIPSADSGASLANPAWHNTCYDFEFDRYRQGTVYSLWSGRHDAPYETASTDGNWQGGFASADISDDSWTSLDVTWDRSIDGTALPGNSIPVKMSVVYPEGASVTQPGGERTIWVACFNNGFFRSDDSGKTFSAVNGGLTAEGHAVDANGFIYASDVETSEDGSQVFGILARRVKDSSVPGYPDGAPGQVVRLGDDGATWEPIALPASVTCPRDLTWDEATRTLYISCCADCKYVRTSKDGDYSLPERENVGGGIFVWHPGDAAAVPLDATSAEVGDASSIEGVAIDGAGNLFASDVRGNIWLWRADGGFEKAYESFHPSSKDVQLVAESSDGETRTDTLALPSFGGGMLRVDVTLPAASEGVLLDRTFDESDVESLHGLSVNENGNVVAVAEADGGKCLRFDMSTAKRSTVLFAAKQGVGDFVLSFDVKMESADGSSTGVLYARDIDGERTVQVADFTPSQLWVDHAEGGKLVKWDASTWKNVAIAFHADRKTYDVYVNGELATGEGVPHNARTGIDADSISYFQLTAAGASSAWAMLVDNVRLYTGSELRDIVSDHTARQSLVDTGKVNEMGLAVPGADEIAEAFGKKVHPWVMIDSDDIARIQRERSGNETLSHFCGQVISAADAMNAYKEPTGGMNSSMQLSPTRPASGSLLTYARHLYNRAQIRGLAYLLTKDSEPERAAEYAAKMWADIEAVCQWSDWGWEEPIDTAEMTMGMSIAYDWMYDAWTDDQRAAMRDAIARKSTAVIDAAYHLENAYIHDLRGRTNRGIVVNGSALVGAATVFEGADAYVRAQCCDVAANAMKGLAYPLGEFAPDGAWPEGPGYAYYALDYLGDTVFSVEHLFGSDLGILGVDGLDQAASYMRYVSGPAGTDNYEDSNIRCQPAVYFWLGTAFPGAPAALFQLDDAATRELTLDYPNEIAKSALWYRTAWESDTSSIALTRKFDGAEYFSMRSGWGSDATFVGLHGGAASGSHGHLDNGTFVVDMLGERWASDIGPESYSLGAYNDDRRYSVYRASPEGHNCLVINPTSSALYQDTNANSEIVEMAGGYAVMDLTSTYAANATSVKRGWRLDDSRRSVVIRDEVELSDDAVGKDVYWFMQTEAAVKVEEGGRSALLTLNGKQVRLSFATDVVASDAVLSVGPAQPLGVSPSISGQSSNDGYKRIAFKLAGAKSMYIQAKLAPASDGFADAGATADAALSGWGVESSGVASSWGAWKTVKAPTCTASGTEQRIDVFDPSFSEARTVSALGHDWESAYTVDVAATPTKVGSKSKHCKRCSERKSVTVIPATGRIDISKAKVSLSKSTYTYSGTACKPAVKAVTLGSKKLAADRDYKVSSYSGNTSAGTATVTVTGIGDYTGKASASFKINPKPVTPTVALSASSYAYNGKARKPAVTVKVGSKKLAASGYRVSYASGRKNVGSYKVAVSLKGNYKGSKAVAFKIVPKATSLTKLVATKRGFTAKWARRTAQTGGYQLQYSTSKAFKSPKTVKVASAKTASKKVAKLKPKKRYYVRVRTYKKAGSTTYCSAWSKAKAVMTKK